MNQQPSSEDLNVEEKEELQNLLDQSNLPNDLPAII